jgi:hypothetical protein
MAKKKSIQQRDDLFPTKLHVYLRKKLVNHYVWSMAET